MIDAVTQPRPVETTGFTKNVFSNQSLAPLQQTRFSQLAGSHCAIIFYISTTLLWGIIFLVCISVCLCATRRHRSMGLSYAKEVLSISSIIFARWQQTPYLGKEGRKGSLMAPFETATVVSYRLSLVTIALSLTIRPPFAIECLWRSNQQGVGHFGAKFREEGVDQCTPKFKAIWERHGAVLYKRNRVDILCHLSTMHERARQTAKPIDRRRNDVA